jgi:AcrR family transcriptional regulator
MCARPRSAEKEQEILEAATALFAQNGYANVTVPEVAARAGVGLGTLYLRYPSKEALGNAVFRHCKEAWRLAVLEEWSTRGSARAQFHAYWARMERFVEACPSEAHYLETNPIGHDLDQESQALRDRLSVRSAAHVQAWIDSGEVRPLPIEVVAALVHGTFWRLASAPRPTRATLRKGRDAVWRALAAAGP